MKNLFSACFALALLWTPCANANAIASDPFCGSYDADRIAARSCLENPSATPRQAPTGSFFSLTLLTEAMEIDNAGMDALMVLLLAGETTPRALLTAAPAPVAEELSAPAPGALIGLLTGLAGLGALGAGRRRRAPKSRA